MMLKRFLEKCVYRWAIANLKFKGNKEEIAELKFLVRQMTLTHTGRQILRKAINARKPRKLTLSFSRLKEGNGTFYSQNNSVELHRIATNLPEMTAKQKIKAYVQMAGVLAHELQHAVTHDMLNKMHQNSANFQEYKLAHTISETNAYLWENIFTEELKEYHHIQPMVYAYHHPNDSKSRMRPAKGPDDPDFIKYHGIVLQPVKASQSRQSFLDKSIQGKIKSVNWSVQSNIDSDANSDSTFTFNQESNKAVFNSVLQFFISDMGLKTSAQDVYKQFMQVSSHSATTPPSVRSAQNNYGR